MRSVILSFLVLLVQLLLPAWSHPVTAGRDPAETISLSSRAPICTSCHGMPRILPRKDPRSPTHRLRIPETCGHCHSDLARMRPYRVPIAQVAEYRRGIHGRILTEWASHDGERTRLRVRLAELEEASTSALPSGQRALKTESREKGMAILVLLLMLGAPLGGAP